MVCVLAAVFLAASFLMCVFLPQGEYSDSERRKLAVPPELSADTIFNGRFMSEFETYAQDHFPFRDQFRTLKALSAACLFQRKDNNGIYVFEGSAAAMEYPMDEASLSRAASRFRYLYQKYLDDTNKVYLSIIPDKNCYLAEQSGHLSIDYSLLEEQLLQQTGFADYISISDLLESGDYYRTDVHWRTPHIHPAPRTNRTRYGLLL